MNLIEVAIAIDNQYNRLEKHHKKIKISESQLLHRDYWAEDYLGSPRSAWMLKTLIHNERHAKENGFYFYGD